MKVVSEQNEKKDSPKSLTPLMVQYQKIKAAHQDAVLFFRLGDFYEMFNTDALEVSRLLQLTLTHRGGDPMCGVPHHAAKIYISRLLKHGKKIAICEQVGTPTGKGLTERKVVEVITPGSTVEDDYLENGTHNFIACLCTNLDARNKDFISFSYLDVSTADFFTSSWHKNDLNDHATKEISRLMPKELLVSQDLEKETWLTRLQETYPSMIVSFYQNWHFSQELSYKRLLQQFKTLNLKSFELLETSPEIASAGFLIDYVSKNLGSTLSHITSISRFIDSKYIIFDESSRKNLEILTNLRDGSSQYTLFEVLAKTITPMGNRLLRSWLSAPLTDKKAIEHRHTQVSEFFNDRKLLEMVRKNLLGISDIERISSRIAMDRAIARDLNALKESLKAFITVRSFFTLERDFCRISLDAATEIVSLIENAILDSPANALNEGALIKRGYSDYLDHLHDVQNNFSSILDDYLAQEKEKTGIQNLKVRCNRINGYYMEVSKGNLDAVPEHFIRRRSMMNGDRFTTDRLIELEQELLSASEKIIDEERRLFLAIREQLQTHIAYLFSVSHEIAELDVISNFAFCAQTYSWTLPQMTTDDSLEIYQGRHPVVEFHLPSGEFVPNDLILAEQPFALITGPNMAGKSTYLRQTALIVLLAQMGSYVPATKAVISIVDRIFCRVGASDNLARGESTFLIEMSETAHILRKASRQSLVIMDEVGRGTSTEDGLSIAWAISEYILNCIGVKTLFATHYHELTRLVHDNMQLLCFEVFEENDVITFLKRVKVGASENSYGIHVAKLAGLPHNVVQRANELLQIIQKQTYQQKMPVPQQILEMQKSETLDLFSNEDLLINEILSLDVNNLTPLEALQKITHWKTSLQ
ncbi:MAG: DNA mismatch repair protein MutS [Treponemataceae bacterium]